VSPTGPACPRARARAPATNRQGEQQCRCVDLYLTCLGLRTIQEHGLGTIQEHGLRTIQEHGRAPWASCISVSDNQHTWCEQTSFGQQMGKNWIKQPCNPGLLHCGLYGLANAQSGDLQNATEAWGWLDCNKQSGEERDQGFWVLAKHELVDKSVRLYLQLWQERIQRQGRRGAMVDTVENFSCCRICGRLHDAVNEVCKQGQFILNIICWVWSTQNARWPKEPAKNRPLPVSAKLSLIIIVGCACKALWRGRAWSQSMPILAYKVQGSATNLAFNDVQTKLGRLSWEESRLIACTYHHQVAPCLCKQAQGPL